MFRNRWRWHLVSAILGMLFIVIYYEITGHMPYRSGPAPHATLGPITRN